MDVLRMKKELGIESVPEVFCEIYNKIKDSYEVHSGLILSEDYIRETISASYTLAKYPELILQAAEKVRKNDAMRLLVCILEEWVKNGGNANDKSYTPPQGEGVEYDFLHLFPAIPTMKNSVAFLRSHNIPEDVIVSTMQEYDMCIEMCRINIGRAAFDRGRLGWISHVINNNILWVNRLRFEFPVSCVEKIRVYKNQKGDLCVFADGMHIHRNGRLVGSVGCEDDAGSFVAEVCETESEIIGNLIVDGDVKKEKTTLSKQEWELCLSKGDTVVAVHIPRGEDFNPESMEASYNRIREIMRDCFPDIHYKAFHCKSWMMSRDLRKVLKPESNILSFQNKYIHYPTVSSGEWILGNVFPGEGGIANLEKFSEETSLQRNVKALYKNGDYIYDDCGFFF